MPSICPFHQLGAIFLKSTAIFLTDHFTFRFCVICNLETVLCTLKYKSLMYNKKSCDASSDAWGSVLHIAEDESEEQSFTITVSCYFANFLSMLFHPLLWSSILTTSPSRTTLSNVFWVHIYHNNFIALIDCLCYFVKNLRHVINTQLHISAISRQICSTILITPPADHILSLIIPEYPLQ